MNKKIIKETIDRSIAGTMTFPQVVGTLLKEGVESYHVDMVRYENRYYTSAGETLVEALDIAHDKAAQEFSAPQVAAAVRKVQAGKSNYQDFVKEILKAGCVYYIAYLDGKKVAYFGRKGDAHIEHFPQK